MTPQMDLIYVSDTGHILSVFTRAARPQQSETAPDAFVGGGLHVRGLETPPASPGPYIDYNNEDFVIPSDHLAFLSIDQTPSALAAPRGSYLDSNKKLQPLTLITSASASLAASSLTITLAPMPPTGLKYLVLIAKQSQGTSAMPLTPSSTGGGSLAVTIPSLAAGAYYALIFVATYSAAVASFNV